MMDHIKQITELGSFGMIVAIFVGLGWAGKRAIGVFEHFARSLERSIERMGDALDKIAKDNAAHFAKDDVVQVRIADDLDRMSASNSEEHAVIRALIELHHGKGNGERTL